MKTYLLFCVGFCFCKPWLYTGLEFQSSFWKPKGSRASIKDIVHQNHAIITWFNVCETVFWCFSLNFRSSVRARWVLSQCLFGEIFHWMTLYSVFLPGNHLCILQSSFLFVPTLQDLTTIQAFYSVIIPGAKNPAIISAIRIWNLI